jgi:uncharacterized protein YidB (DUF937 family)
MDILKSVLGSALGGQQGAQASAAGGLDPQMLMGIVTTLMNNAGGLQGILAKLQQGGLADVVASWVGTGANQPVSADALGSALGPDLMGMIAKQLGGNTQQAAGTLAQVLPGLIDQLTPQGQLPADNGLGALGALLGGGQAGSGPDLGALGDLLGGLMKR